MNPGLMPEVASHAELKHSSSSSSSSSVCYCLTHCVNYFPVFNTKIRADSDVTAEAQPIGKDIPA